MTLLKRQRRFTASYKYVKFDEQKQNMFQTHKFESFYPENGEVTIVYKKIFDRNESARGYDNCEGEVVDITYNEIVSNDDLAEEFSPFEENENDMENYDPALFCPDIIMELGDTPIIINTDGLSNEGSTTSSGSPNSEDKAGNGCFDLTLKENELRKLTYGTDNPVQYARIHCTSCRGHLGSALSQTGNVRVHPLLKVLVCKKCHDFYTSGEFEKDQDGSEKFCRWCGQGGLVICCSTCQFVFCTKCIRNNFGKKVLTDIKDSDEWTCFKCAPSQIIDLRVLCAEFMEYVRRETARAITLDHAAKFTSTDYSTCCSATNTQTNGPKKTKRRYSDDDQDYNPDAERSSRRSSSSSIKSITSICNEVNSSIARKPLAIVSKTMNPTKCTALAAQGYQNSATFSMANSTRPKVTFVAQPKPVAQVDNLSPTAPERRVDSNQIRMLPNGQTVTIRTLRNFGPRETATQTAQAQPNGSGDFHQRKKTCYETAVRAATRINSDLSCGLIKLREDQAGARKLEDLVVVHNKLHEVLNTSINSLVHLRKTIADTNNLHKHELSPKQFLVRHNRASNARKVGNTYIASTALQDVNFGEGIKDGVAELNLQYAPFLIYAPESSINLL